MLEWTGERFLPWRNDPALAYEHLHRYFYASRFAQGKTVLDLASGEGYGSNLLAQVAHKVVGVDIAREAVEHARQRYRRENLEFITGSITSVPILENHTFDLIVCFEAIEHINAQEALLGEIVRLLTPAGVLIVSTPNKPVYDQANAEENEFHVKELEFDEFRSLLESRFANVRYLGQRVYAQSNLWPIFPGNRSATDPKRIEEFVIRREGMEFRDMPEEDRSPIYHIAIASNSPFDREFAASILVDNDNSLLHEKDREIQNTQREAQESLASAAEALRWRETQIKDQDETIQWFKGEVEALRNKQAWYEEVVAVRDATIASNDDALKWRAGQVEFLENEKADLINRLQAISVQLERTTEQLEAIHASSGWKILLRIRHYREKVFPGGSSQRRFLDRLLHVFAGKS